MKTTPQNGSSSGTSREFSKVDKDELVVSGAAQIRKWVRPENSSRLRSDRLNAVGS